MDLSSAYRMAFKEAVCWDSVQAESYVDVKERLKDSMKVGETVAAMVAELVVMRDLSRGIVLDWLLVALLVVD